jgi:hypothetical protein
MAFTSRYCDFEKSHINGEAILYIRIGQSFVSFVDLLDWDYFNVGGYVMFATKVKHVLHFGNTPDERTREAATLEQKASTPVYNETATKSDSL